MKKLGKFLFGTLSVTALAAGAYYLYKNATNKDLSDEFDDFEDELEDFELEDEDVDSREYVSINITATDVAADTEDASEDEATDSQDSEEANREEA